MLNTRDLLRSAYSAACDYNKHYKKVVQNMHRYMGLSEKRDADWIVSLMLGRSETLPSDLHMKCKFFEEEGGDLPRSESYSNDEEEEREEPLKSDGDSQGCTPVPPREKKFPGLLNFLYSIMAKAKNIAAEEIKNTHTFF